MTEENRVVLGVLRHRTSDGEYEHRVEYWLDYGVVCPSLWTTNGSVSYVVNRIEERIAALAAHGWTWEPAYEDTSGSLQEQLQRASREWVREANSG